MHLSLDMQSNFPNSAYMWLVLNVLILKYVISKRGTLKKRSLRIREIKGTSYLNPLEVASAREGEDCLSDLGDCSDGFSE